MRWAFGGSVESDPILRVAGAEGERQLARLRILICGVLVLAAGYRLLRGPDSLVLRSGLGLTLGGLVAALVVCALMPRGRYRPWLGLLSSAIDVTLVTAALGLWMLVDSPLQALNSRVTFEIYFLALTAAALRYDRFICLWAGILALLEYGSLLAWAALRWDLEAEALRRSTWGDFEFSEQVTRMALLGLAVVLAWHLVARAQRLLVLSNRDPVTGIGNRVFFEAAAASELTRANRHDLPCAIVVVDVDHFKRFNDRHGHTVGDQVLRGIAAILMRHVRATDIVARWGGEEFVLVLPNLSLPQSRQRLETIRNAVAAAPVRFAAGPAPEVVTISVGIAAFPEDGCDLATLFATADARMLIAKQRGRDCVVAEHSPEEWQPLRVYRSGRATPAGGWPRVVT